MGLMKKLSDAQQDGILILFHGGWVAKNTLNSLIRRGLAENRWTGQAELTDAGLNAWWEITSGRYEETA